MTTAETQSFTLPLASPFETANGPIEHRRGIAVRLRDGTHAGVGEATPLPGWTESYEACRTAIDDVLGPDGSLTRLPAPPAARHALQLARIDLASRRAGRPLAAYVSPEREIPDTIPCNATVGNGDRDESVAAARSAVASGATVLKCKVGGRPIEAESNRIRAVRQAIGTDVTLRLDANRGWTPAEARRIWPTLEEIDVSYVEEPIVDPSPVAFADLAGPSVGIAVDETVVETSQPVEEWFAAVDTIVLKPMALGGFDRALALAMRARRRDVRPVVSGTVDGVIARTAGVHLAAALPDPAPVGLATGRLLASDLGRDPAPVRAGTMTVPDRPGIGTDGAWEGDG